jgi:UDP-N-acetylglucosamine--N-acetylmuramyl-(pentapeptide) pyrophosphoryl-undecaprenol N-acetylglucosamine transferase
MVLTAARRKIPTALMEADAHLGLANRLAAPFARRVFLSFPVTGRAGPKYRVTGRPIPQRSHATAQGEGRALFGLPSNGPVLLVFGGSLGARVLNELAVSAFGMSGAALGASDLVLARAGGSVWEVAAAAKPAVLVPGDFATGDHQTKNARYFEEGGGAVVVPEREVSRAPDVVRSLLADPARLEEMSGAMRKLARPNAADEIAEELVALAA